VLSCVGRKRHKTLSEDSAVLRPGSQTHTLCSSPATDWRIYTLAELVEGRIK